MGFGTKLPEGMLPVFSVGSEDEAQRLLATCCPLNYQGEYIASELVAEQTLENLEAFGQRLQQAHDLYLKGTEACSCGR